VEAQGPEWWKGWLTKIVVILSEDGLGITAEEEVNVQVSAGCNVTQKGLSIRHMSGDWGLGVGASEEHAEELIGGVVLICLDQTEWMYAR